MRLLKKKKEFERRDAFVTVPTSNLQSTSLAQSVKSDVTARSQQPHLTSQVPRLSTFRAGLDHDVSPSPVSLPPDISATAGGRDSPQVERQPRSLTAVPSQFNTAAPAPQGHCRSASVKSSKEALTSDRKSKIFSHAEALQQQRVKRVYL